MGSATTRAPAARPLGREIVTAVVDYDYFGGQRLWHRANDVVNRIRFVESRDNDRHFGAAKLGGGFVQISCAHATPL
jgi:hypothetical protein